MKHIGISWSSKAFEGGADSQPHPCGSGQPTLPHSACEHLHKWNACPLFDLTQQTVEQPPLVPCVLVFDCSWSRLTREISQCKPGEVESLR